MTSAASQWSAALESWRLPDRLIEAVTDTTFTSPPALWRRARLAEARHGTGETTRVVRELLGASGTLLDVGAGTGRLSVPIAGEGFPVTAVEPDEAMAEGLAAEAKELGITVRRVAAMWPDAAGEAGPHDVVLCANVVYNVPDLPPFLKALHAAAVRGVVVELTPSHPWTHLTSYYRAVHDHQLPVVPTADTFCDVVTETLGITPERIDWSRGGVHRFADLQELIAYYGRRLLVPAERAEELMRVLGPDVREEDGWLVLGDPVRPSVTVWWPAG